jgi:hypothetical protein
MLALRLAELCCNHQRSPQRGEQVALTSAEKQARYRQRHLGDDGDKTRIQLLLNAATRARLDRLARHSGCTVTALIEELAAAAERRVTTKLAGKALNCQLPICWTHSVR